MPKKIALLSTLNSLSISPLPYLPGSSTSPPSQQRARCLQCRTYADVRSSPDLSWPENLDNSRHPTPYEIFHLGRNQEYSKRSFYELVKLYHPDRNGHIDTYCGGISEVTKLERYRLIVLAHEILSDPDKRKKYDLHGIGWVDRNGIPKHHHGFSSTTGKTYTYGSDYRSSPFSNATWEDWERWYARNEQDPQSYEGEYISQNGFASMIILMAVLAGFLQATNAGQYSTSLEDKVRSLNAEASQFMQSRAGETSQLGTDGRIKLFLDKRDPTRTGLRDGEGEAYQKVFKNSAPPPPPAVEAGNEV